MVMKSHNSHERKTEFYKWTNGYNTNPDEGNKKSIVILPSVNNIRMRMESLWMNFVLVIVFVTSKSYAASSNSGFVSSVLPSTSTSILYQSIQNTTSGKIGGFTTTIKSSNSGKLAIYIVRMWFIYNTVSKRALLSTLTRVNITLSLPVHMPQSLIFF